MIHEAVTLDTQVRSVRNGNARARIRRISLNTIRSILLVLFLGAGIGLSARDEPSGIPVAPHDGGQGGNPQGARLTAVRLERPAPGEIVYDPLFDLDIRRLGENNTHVYSQLQAFSHDNAYVILIDHERGYHVRTFPDLDLVSGSVGWHSAFRWIPGTHQLISVADDPARLLLFDCVTGAWSDLFELSEYDAVDGSRSYEELSRDGTWTALYVHNSSKDSPSIVTVNIRELRVGFHRSILDMGAVSEEWGLLEPDWVGVSPLGRYAVVQWVRDDTIPASGFELYDIESGEFVRRLFNHHGHSDMGISEDGREYVVTGEMESPINHNFPGIVIHWMDGEESIHLRPMPWGRTEHFSAQGLPGVTIVTAGDEFDGAYAGEIYAIRLDGSIQRLTHHRSSSGDYWVQPKASTSPDGSIVLWSSDWGVEGDRDAYVIENLILNPPPER